MSQVFKTLQERYQRLLARTEKDELEKDVLEEMRTFIADAQRAGAAVADLNERSQLRSWLRFLANVLYDASGVYPDTSLEPLARGKLVAPQPKREKEQILLPPLGWALVGGAVMVIIVGLLLMIQRPAYRAEAAPTPAPTPSSTPKPTTPAGEVAVGLGKDSAGGLALQTELFCAGTTELMARFTAPAPLPANAQWGWKLARGGRTVATESPLGWETGSASRAVRVTAPDGESFEAGQYEITFLIDDRPAATRAFEVLAEEPRVSHLQISEAPNITGRTEFESDVRIIYAAYDYENLCPGASITHTIYHEGEQVGEKFAGWSGSSRGSGRWEYYQPSGLPLPGGEYELLVDVEGGEPQKTTFVIAGATPPAFGEIAVALGVHPDGDPILSAQENRPFGSSTRVVYAIFEHVGMRDGLDWSVVWTRNGEEVHREERVWDVDDAATEDVHWAAYYREDGEPLGGGLYSVELYIGGALQRTAEFQIYYPAE